MLSNSDIKKEIGTNILIYPFKLENIRGSSLNLTASRLAWSLSSKKSIVQDNKIVISPNDTALIETEECLYVSSNISGTYHSKVSLVSEGLGHISTLLDPEWIGNSLIAVHNLTTSTIEIEIGKTFVSLCFYYLRTNSTYADNANTPGRPQILLNNGIVLSKEENEIMGEDWRSNKKDLKKKLLDSEQYKSLLDLKDKKIVTRRNFVSYILPFIVFIIAYLLLFFFKDDIKFRIATMRIDECLIVVGLSGLALQIPKLCSVINYLFDKRKKNK